MADGGNVILGQDNQATRTTRLSRSGRPTWRPGFFLTSALEVNDDRNDAINGYSPSGYGVVGVSDTFSGVYGESVQGAGTEGYSEQGAGATGFSEQITGVVGISLGEKGVYGESVKAHADADWMNNEFSINNIAEIGVHGANYQGGGIGVFGEADVAFGFGTGVLGIGNTHGVYGSGGRYGVLAHSPIDGLVAWNDNRNTVQAWLASQLTDGSFLAGDFYGDVRVNGRVSKAGGGFQIDHPLDPANRHLSHSFVESPDMKNIYDGVVRLDAKGEAIVELPAWFTALNSDYRYQLTAIGAPAPELHIAREIERNRFKIAGGKRGSSVSWQVTGIRQDAWARANRIVVEETKPENERGSYMHPTLHKQSDKKSVQWARHTKVRFKSEGVGKAASKTTGKTTRRKKTDRAADLLRILEGRRRRERLVKRKKS